MTDKRKDEIQIALDMCEREEIYNAIKNTLGDRFLQPFMTLKLFVKQQLRSPPVPDDVAEASTWLRQHIGTDYLNNKQREMIEVAHEKLTILIRAASTPSKGDNNES